MNENTSIKVTGRIQVYDDEALCRDVCNDIHPQNFARLLARGLAHESNSHIYRIAYGNGGTVTNAAGSVSMRPPNIGVSPDVYTWESRLYNEIYSEVVDAASSMLSDDVGSADVNTGIRPGGGAVPSNDPPSVMYTSGPGVRSFEQGEIAKVVITTVLNQLEPTSQYLRDIVGTTSGDFTFDEIALYSYGSPAISTPGYQAFEVGVKTTSSDTKLTPGRAYMFDVAADGGSSTRVSFVVPESGGSGLNGEILYGDLCDAINLGRTSWGMSGVNPLPGGATLTITDDTDGIFATTAGAQTHGTLKVTSGTVGNNSRISLVGNNTSSFMTQLNSPGGCTLTQAVTGKTAGVQNDPTAPQTERERLITHAVFEPVTKPVGRRMTIVYTLSLIAA